MFASAILVYLILPYALHTLHPYLTLIFTKCILEFFYTTSAVLPCHLLPFHLTLSSMSYPGSSLMLSSTTPAVVTTTDNASESPSVLLSGTSISVVLAP
jgi:hypothetical protein